MQKRIKYLFLILVCASNAHVTFAQDYSYFTQRYARLRGDFYLSASDKIANEVLQNNEFERNEGGQESVIPSNPLLLDGKKVDFSRFSLQSTGLLTVVKSIPVTGEVLPISFYVSLRRNGKLLDDKKMRFTNKPLDKIELAEIFAFAKEGDMLILTPVKKEDCMAKRILKLIFNGC